MKSNRTVARAVQILHLLRSQPGGMTISEISNTLQMPKSSTHDIVRTLFTTHVLREVGKRYFIGFGAQEIGDAYEPTQDLYGIAKTHLVATAEAYGMTGSLVSLQGLNLEYTLTHRAKGSIVAPADNGDKKDLHAVASGKVFLAFSPPAKQKKMLTNIGYTQFTPQTITSKDMLLEELEQIKRQGYAVDHEEYHELLTCVSAPLFLQTGLVAAVTLSGLGVKKQIVEKLGGTVVQLSKAIAQNVIQASQS